MTHGPWVLRSADAEYVTWACSKCGVEVGFWKPGNLSGSTPTAAEDAHPENIADYVPPVCEETPV